jgi:hypothetical protein
VPEPDYSATPLGRKLGAKPGIGEPRRLRYPACEVAVFSQYTSPRIRFVRAGTLDDPAGVARDVHSLESGGVVGFGGCRCGGPPLVVPADAVGLAAALEREPEREALEEDDVDDGVPRRHERRLAAERL